MKHGLLRTTDTPALCDKNDLEYYIEKYKDMESCYRSVVTKHTDMYSPSFYLRVIGCVTRD